MNHSYATFLLEDQLFGVRVDHVQEVLENVRLTQVPLAPPSVSGLLNLRGQIVVALDMRVQFGRPPRPPGAPCVHVVVRLDGEAVSLLFDRVADVVDVADGDQEPVPPTLPEAVKVLAPTVVTQPHAVLLLLDLDRAATVN